MGSCCGKSNSTISFEMKEKNTDSTDKPYQMRAQYSCIDISPSNVEDQPLLKNKNVSQLPKEPSIVIPKKEYKATKGDKVDETLARIVNGADIQLPIYRIGEGKYLLGTESKMCMIKGNSCVVRIGGGFQTLEEYLLSHQAAEIDKIAKLMEDQSKTYNEVVRDLLVKFNAEQIIIN